MKSDTFGAQQARGVGEGAAPGLARNDYKMGVAHLLQLWKLVSK